MRRPAWRSWTTSPFTKESTTRNDNDFTTQSMDYKDVGVKLKITPRISDDGSLRLEVEQEVSRVTQGLITLTNGDQLVAPTTRKRLVKTTILLQDSQTAVIGGLLDDQKTYNQSEVPGLGSIPGLGWLFKSRNKKVDPDQPVHLHHAQGHQKRGRLRRPYPRKTARTA